jgi:membrane fusion protein (multidrug efflux system)
VAIALTLLIGWGVWAVAGRVAVVAVSKRARFESRAAVREIAVPVSGRIRRVHIALGQEVRSGEVLLELDDADAVIRRDKALAGAEHLRRRIDAVAAQIAATRAMAAAQTNAAAARLREAREGRIEAGHLADIESARADRLTRLGKAGLVSPSEATDARSRAEAERARGRGLAAAEEEARRKQAEALSTAEASVRALESDRIELEALRADAQAAVEQAGVDIERQRIRAPADGRIGSSAELRTGTWVEEGAKVASIVPVAAMEVAAWFSLEDMPLLRIGQNASIWLESLGRGGRRRFAAVVTGIERDRGGSDFRVTLRLARLPATVDEGFPATVTVEVQRLSPFDALLRAAGMLPAAKPAT